MKLGRLLSWSREKRDGGKHLDRLSRDNFSLGAIEASHVAGEDLILITAIIMVLKSDGDVIDCRKN